MVQITDTRASAVLDQHGQPWASQDEPKEQRRHVPPSYRSRTVTYQDDPANWVNQWYNIVPDPDPIINNKREPDRAYAHRLAIAESNYDKVGHLQCCVDSRRSALLSRDWYVKPTGTTPEALLLQEIVEQILTTHLKGFWSFLHQLWMGRYYGCGYGEFTRFARQQHWFTISKGEDQAGKPIQDEITLDLDLPVSLANHKPWLFLYAAKTDRNDDEQFEMRVLTKAEPVRGEPVPHGKIITYKPDTRWGLPHGVGLFRSAYFPCLWLRDDFGNWMRWLERMAAPIIILTLSGTSAGRDGDRTDAQNIVTSVENLTGVVLEPDEKLELLSDAFKASTGNSFSLLNKTCEAIISKLVLGQTMTTDDGSSRSQAEVHYQVRQDKILDDARTLTEVINEQIIQPIVEINFPPHLWRLAPTFEFDLNDPDPEKALKIILDAQKAGITVDEEQAREQTTLRKPEEGCELKPPQSAVPAFGAPAPVEEIEQGAESGKPEASALLDAVLANAEAASEAKVKLLDKIPGGSKTLRALMVEGVAAIEKHTRKIAGHAQEWVLSAGKDAGIDPADELDPAAIDWDSYELPDGLVAALTEILHEHWLLIACYGRLDTLRAAREADAKAYMAHWSRMLTGQASIEISAAEETLIPRRALEVFEASLAHAVDYETFYQMNSVARAEAFTAAWLPTDHVRRIGGALATATRHGYTLQQFADMVYERLEPRYSASGMEGELIYPHHLSSIYHTNLARIHSYAVMDETVEMEDTFPYLQFVNSDPEFPFCVEMAGRVYRVSDPVWRGAMPPAHFCCGSNVRPLTELQAKNAGLTVSVDRPINEPMHYAGPVDDTGQPVGTLEPFGAWRPLQERYDALPDEYKGDNDA